MAQHSNPICPADLYVSRLGTHKSRETARCALRTLARAFGMSPIDWSDLTYADVARARAALTMYSPAWGSTCHSILRSVLKEARCLHLIGQGFLDDVLALPPIRGYGGRLGRDVSDSEIATLVGAIDSTSIRGRRDGAIVALLLGGLRCAEAMNVHVNDFDKVSGRLVVRAGKGRKHREIPLGVTPRRFLELWLSDHPGTGPLLRSVDRWGYIGQRLSTRGVQTALICLCDQAGIERLSPHALRAHQITAVASRGDVFIAQLFAGHCDLSTTQRYDRRGFAALEQVMARMPEPGVQVAEPERENRNERDDASLRVA